MALVAHQSSAIIARPEFILSTGPSGDETFLSQRTNEISEAVYAQSQALQAVKGYLSIFRNLTDLQPLADGVIQRLAGPSAQPTDGRSADSHGNPDLTTPAITAYNVP